MIGRLRVPARSPTRRHTVGVISGLIKVSVGNAEGKLASLTGVPAGGWIGAVLEGLYAAWMAAQPGADTNLVARRTAVLPGQVSLRYGRD